MSDQTIEQRLKKRVTEWFGEPVLAVEEEILQLLNEAKKQGFKHGVNSHNVIVADLVNEARNKALEDVKFYGYGYDNGAEFVIQISYKQLNSLKITSKDNK